MLKIHEQIIGLAIMFGLFILIISVWPLVEGAVDQIPQAVLKAGVIVVAVVVYGGFIHGQFTYMRPAVLLRSKSISGISALMFSLAAWATPPLVVHQTIFNPPDPVVIELIPIMAIAAFTTMMYLTRSRYSGGV